MKMPMVTKSQGVTGQLPHKLWAVRTLLENLLLVRKLLSKNAKFEAENSHFEKMYGNKLKL